MNNSEQYRRECEAREVLKMNPDKREEFYKGVLNHRKQRGLDALVAEVKRQLKLEAGRVVLLSDEKRQEYYRNAFEARGQKGVDELIAEVKKLRRELAKKQTLEMEV